MRASFIFLLVALLTGCASLPPPPPPDAAVAQCSVCRYCRDFSCLEVPKTSSTPKTVYEGKTYWFCSEHCREAFGRAPAKYAGE